MSTFERLQQVIADTLRVPPSKVTATTKNEDISAWESLGHVKLMMALEQTFDIYLDVEDFSRLDSVPAIIGYLKEKGIE